MTVIVPGKPKPPIVVKGGVPGPRGDPGPPGPPGQGVPNGGATGQVATKASDDDYDIVWAAGGVTDGDKGDITVSGAAWTINDGAVTDEKIAGVAWTKLSGVPALFDGTWGSLTGKPSTFPPSAHGHAAGEITGLAATATSTDAANLTGTLAAARIADGSLPLGKLASLAASTILGNNGGSPAAPTALTVAQVKTLLAIAAGDVSGLAAVATSGSASDLSSGTLPAARFNDTAHGTRAGGTLHASATTSVAGFMSGADKTKLDGVATGATANATDAALRDRSTHTGTQAASTISDFSEAVDDRVAALAVAGANMTITYDDGAGTLTFAAAGGGGGSPGGASGEVQWNNGGAFAGAADVEIEGGQLRLPAIATPAVPAAGGLKLFGRSVAGRIMPAFIGPSGLDSSVQPFLARNKVAYALPNGNGTVVGQLGLALTGTGTPSAKNWASTNRYTRMRGIEYLVTTAATTAVAGFRGAAQQFTIGGGADGDGGFHMVCRWAPATGVATATNRGFCGLLAATAAPVDVEPSSRTLFCGMGWDAADTNIQFMHNDGAGTATKIDLGSSFPVPTTDRDNIYELAMFSPPGTTQSLSYEVRNLGTGDVATGTVTTDIPGTGNALNPYGIMSVGGTSSVIGFCLFSLYIETDY